MKILQATYSPSIQTGPDDVYGHNGGLVVNLPAAITIGDRVSVRSQPDNPGGYPEELASVPQADLLLAQTDILLDGRFEKDSLERKRHWVGSTNKRVHYLSDRYQPGLEYPAEGERVRGPHKGPYGRVERL